MAYTLLSIKIVITVPYHKIVQSYFELAVVNSASLFFYFRTISVLSFLS